MTADDIFTIVIIVGGGGKGKKEFFRMHFTSFDEAAKTYLDVD